MVFNTLPYHREYDFGTLIPLTDVLHHQLSERIDALEREACSPLNPEKILEITQLVHQRMLLPIPSVVQEKLPLDLSLSPITTTNDEYDGEAMVYSTFSHRDLSDGESIKSFVDSKMKEVFLDKLETLIAPDQLAQMARKIEDALEEGREVSLLGSSIRLKRVRKMESMVVKPSESSQKWIEQADHYCVVNQVLMGGLFLGIEVKRPELNMNLPSIIALGAFALSGRNLWESYSHWKDKLLTDPWAGHPVSFRCRKLSDCLAEGSVSR